MDPKDIDFSQIFSNLDLRPLKQMIAFILAGKEPPMEEYSVMIRVPAAIVECLRPICDHLDITIEDVLSKMASEGFSQQMKEQMGELGQKKAQQPNSLEGLEGLGLDLSGLSEKMGDLNGVIGKLEEMQKVFSDIVSIPQAANPGVRKEKGNNPEEDPKDPT